MTTEGIDARWQSTANGLRCFESPKGIGLELLAIAGHASAWYSQAVAQPQIRVS